MIVYAPEVNIGQVPIGSDNASLADFILTPETCAPNQPHDPNIQWELHNEFHASSFAQICEILKGTSSLSPHSLEAIEYTVNNLLIDCN